MDCVDLTVIPQFDGICWFNAILTVALYSQNVRKILIKESKNWSKSNSFLMIIKAILVKYYNQPDKVLSFFNKIKPEVILFKMLRTFNDTEIIAFFKKMVKNGGDLNLGFDSEYIIRFFKYLKINVLDIIVMKQKGWIYNRYKYYLNTDKEFTYKYADNGYKITVFKDEVLEQYKKPEDKHKMVFEETSKILENVPEILIVKHEDLFEITKSYYPYMTDLVKGYESSSYKFDIRGLDTYNDTIYLNGHTYKLDAVTLINYYDQNELSHTIAGITCKDQHYVYNGWYREPSDSENIEELSPCSLMKFDWDLKKNEEFCLNTKTCKLDFIKSKDLCFSFAKGQRILIYTKVDAISSSKMSSMNSRLSSLELSGVSGVIKDIYNIKNLTKDEIIANLMNYFDIEVSSSMSRDKLEKEYNKALLSHYNLLKGGKRKLKSNKKK